jgi:hypothetical protein
MKFDEVLAVKWNLILVTSSINLFFEFEFSI